MKINRGKLDKTAAEKGIKFIILFGSHVAGRVRKDSDFDVAVLTEERKNIGKSLDYYNDILFFLSDALDIPDYKLDLTNLNNSNPLLRYEVVFGGKLLYGDRTDYDEYKAFAFKDYIDATPLFNLEKYLIKKRQRLLGQALTL
ncbi:MAG: nucleotidyltransferase domain-containing protein [Nitrospirae bacterium]|nr:nucleotidyltransferase domain-containing protein [Nitrospirota bacterium]